MHYASIRETRLSPRPLYDRLRIIDCDSEFLRGVLRTIQEMEHLYITSEKKKKRRNLFRLGRVIHLHFAISGRCGILVLLCEFSMKTQFTIVFLVFSACSVVNEDDRIHDVSADARFRINGENYRRGDCIEYTTDVLRIYRGKIQNRFNEHANRYIVFRVRYCVTKQ